MSFKASKQRKRRQNEPLLEGTPLIPSAAISGRYGNQLSKLVTAYIRELGEAATGTSGPAMGDASRKSLYETRMAAVRSKYRTIIKQFAEKTARSFVESVNSHSEAGMRSTLNALNKEPQLLPPTPALDEVQSAHILSNVQLISNLTDDAYERVRVAVHESVNTPETGKQGMKGIYDHLREIEDMSRRRAKLIAQDQTSKIYTDLNTKRMSSAGIKTFRWIHSSAGKVPRQCHVDRNNKIFSLEGGPEALFWPDGSDANPSFNARESDYGKPGFAINCRCRMIAAISLDD